MSGASQSVCAMPIAAVVAGTGGKREQDRAGRASFLCSVGGTPNTAMKWVGTGVDSEIEHEPGLLRGRHRLRAVIDAIGDHDATAGLECLARLAQPAVRR